MKPALIYQDAINNKQKSNNMERHRVIALVKLCELLEVGQSTELAGNYPALKYRFLKTKTILEQKGIGLKSARTDGGIIITRDF